MTPIQIIKSYEHKQTFLNIKDFLKFAHLIICISYKGTGKSQSALNYCLERMHLHDEEFVWLRNTDTEIKLSNLESSIVLSLVEMGIDDKYIVKNRGVYKVNENGTHILKGTLADMNRPFNSASQNAFKKCKTVVYDELINPDFNKKNLFSNFMKFVHTMLRKNCGHVILLGNKHEANNDILSELGIEFDWDLNEHQIIHRPEQSVLAMYLTKWEIKDMKNSNELIEKWSMYSPSMRKFSTGGISNNNMKCVVNWYINHIEPLFIPMFKYDLHDTRYCVGKVNNKIYIKQLDFTNEYLEINGKQLPIFCYLPQDKQPDNKFTCEVEDLDTVDFLLRAYSSGSLIFSTAFGFNEFKILLHYLKMLERN